MRPRSGAPQRAWLSRASLGVGPMSSLCVRKEWISTGQASVENKIHCAKVRNSHLLPWLHLLERSQSVPWSFTLETAPTTSSHQRLLFSVSQQHPCRFPTNPSTASKTSGHLNSGRLLTAKSPQNCLVTWAVRNLILQFYFQVRNEY